MNASFQFCFWSFFNFAQNAFLQFFYGFCATDFFLLQHLWFGEMHRRFLSHFSAANKAIMSLKRHYNLLLLSAIYLLFSGTDGQPKICQKFQFASIVQKSMSFPELFHSIEMILDLTLNGCYNRMQEGVLQNVLGCKLKIRSTFHISTEMYNKRSIFIRNICTKI